MPEAVERNTPGLAAFFEKVPEDGGHAVLDLGPGAASSLRVYSRFASRIRFADLIGGFGAPGGWTAALNAIPPQPELPYDLILAWNVLDRVDPAERPMLIKRLAEISAPNARLHLVVEGAGQAVVHPLRFSLLDTDGMRYVATGPARPGLPQLLPAEVERILPPFKVTRAFTSKVGMREYVAVRKEW